MEAARLTEEGDRGWREQEEGRRGADQTRGEGGVSNKQETGRPSVACDVEWSRVKGAGGVSLIGFLRSC